MNNSLTEILVESRHWMFHAGWQTALVAMIAFLLLKLANKRFSAQWRYGLLIIVLLKFAAPPFLTTSAGLFSQPVTSQAIFEPDFPQFVPVKVDEHFERENIASEESSTVDTSVALETKREVMKTKPAVSPRTSATSIWALFFAAVYLVGLMIVAVRIIRQFAFVRRIVQASTLLDKGFLADEVAGISRTLGMKSSPQLLITHDSDAPFASGVLRPVIVLPDSIIDGLQRDQLRIVIAHELVHIRRYDLLLGWLEVLLSAVWWFHPAMWWLRQSLRQTREECCDDVLVAKQIATPERYCETLIEAASRQLSTVAEPVALGFSHREHSAARRIRRLMDATRKRSDRLHKPALLLVVLLAVVLLPGVQPGKGSVKEINLQGIWGWKNLPLHLDEDEEAMVKELVKIVYSYRNTNNDGRVFDGVDTRQRLEDISQERPDFFYAQQLLGIWHSRNGDPEKAARLLRAARTNAPAILTQRYVFGNGEPAVGVELSALSIECNRVENRSLDPSLKLPFPGLVTDENGEVHLPVYDTVYRIAEYSGSKEYRALATRSLGWFKANSRIGVLPEMMLWKPYSRPRDFTRSVDQTQLLRDATGSINGQLDSGDNHYAVGSVARGQADGEFVVEDGEGKIVQKAVLPLPKIKNGQFMDRVVIDLASPEVERFQIGSVHVLDSQTKLPLGQFQSGAGFHHDGKRRFQLFSMWNPLPDTVDLVLEVHNYTKSVVRVDVPAEQGTTVQLGDASLSIPHLIAGHHHGWNSNNGHIGDPHDVSTTSEVQFVFTGNKQRRFAVWVELRNGRRWNVKHGWFSPSVIGGGGTMVAAPLEEIDHFEVFPFVESEMIFFEGIRLPLRRDPLDQNIPVVQFPVNRIPRDYLSDVLSPMTMKFRSEPGRVYSGIGGGTYGVSLSERDPRQREPNDYTTIVWSIDARVDLEVDANFVIAATADARGIGQRNGFSTQGGSYTVGIAVRKVPLQSVEAVQLRLSPKTPK